MHELYPALSDPACPWYEWKVGLLITCEDRVCSWIRQPCNTISSIAFLLVAFYIFYTARKPVERAIALFGGLIGCASTMAHASQVRPFSDGDFLAQFFFFLFLLSQNFLYLGFLSARRRWAVYALLGAFLILLPRIFTWHLSLAIYILFVLALISSSLLLLKRNPQISLRPLWLMLALFFGGVGCFYLDEARIVCTPTNHLFQLHAIWHLLGALALIPLARLYREFDRGRTIL